MSGWPRPSVLRAPACCLCPPQRLTPPHRPIGLPRTTHYPACGVNLRRENHSGCSHRTRTKSPHERPSVCRSAGTRDTRRSLHLGKGIPGSRGCKYWDSNGTGKLLFELRRPAMSAMADLRSCFIPVLLVRGHTIRRQMGDVEVTGSTYPLVPDIDGRQRAIPVHRAPPFPALVVVRNQK